MLMDVSASAVKELETVVRDLAASGGHILFVGTK